MVNVGAHPGPVRGPGTRSAGEIGAVAKLGWPGGTLKVLALPTPALEAKGQTDAGAAYSRAANAPWIHC